MSQLVAVKLKKDHGDRKAGEVRRYDEASAKRLVDAKVGELVDEKKPAQD